jgi:transcription termination factor NusB
MDRELKNDINENKTEIIVKLMIIAAIYEFMFMHKTPIKVVIAEYLKVSDYFVESSQKNFLNAILDKASKISRVNDVTN